AEEGSSPELEAGPAQIDVGADGSVGVQIGDRDLIRVSAQGPIARRFELSVRGATALYTFTRDAEASVQLQLDSGAAKQDAGSVVVPLVSASGLGGGEAIHGNISFSAERPGATRVRVELDAEYDSLALPLGCDSGSSFYGLGGQYNAIDQRGEAFDLFVREQGIGRDPDQPTGLINGGAHTTYFPMPYYLDARGFGVYWRTDHRTLLDLCKTDSDTAWIEVESGEPLELLVFHGPSA